jgi:hypothetical protein
MDTIWGNKEYLHFLLYFPQWICKQRILKSVSATEVKLSKMRRRQRSREKKGRHSTELCNLYELFSSLSYLRLGELAWQAKWCKGKLPIIWHNLLLWEHSRGQQNTKEQFLLSIYRVKNQLKCSVFLAAVCGQDTMSRIFNFIFKFFEK